MVAPGSLKVRSWLLVLALCATVPLVLFSAFTVLELARARQDFVASELSQRAETAASAVGRRLDTIAVSMTVLAQTDAALRQDHRLLYEQAVRYQNSNPGIQAIILDDLNHKQIFNSYKPFGTPLPQSTPWATNERVLQSGSAAISPIYFGAITHQSMMSLSVPVRIDGRIRYFLRAVIQPDTLVPILEEQHLPDLWRAAIVDRACLYVARSHDAGIYVGTPLPQPICNAMTWGEDQVFDTPNRDGILSKAYLAKVPNWDWHVVVAVPTTVFQAPYQRFLLAVMVGGLTLLIIGGALAHWLAYYISSRLSSVVESATRLCQGECPVSSVTHIHELDELNQALGVAGSEKQRVEQVLTQARRDPLTNLPGRDLFVQQTQTLRLGSTSPLTVLFVDLDGFKDVNDTHGHARGDQILRQTADILRRAVRDSDVAGRLGGDEFVLCLQTASQSDAITIANRIIDQVQGIGYSIGCSIGIAHWPQACPDLACAIGRADEAMYEAKHRGKGQWSVYGQQKSDGTPWKTHMERDCWQMCEQSALAVRPA